MRPNDESNVTSLDPSPARAGIWTLAGETAIIADRDGPATILVPTESVLLLAVDLPLASRGKRLDALPFAVEDRIADPVDAVHLALGAELAPRRYLVGVVRHERMAGWIARAQAAGLGQAAFVPDALALPVPPEGEWSVDLGESRAVVRAGDGTGFACPATLLMAAWEAAGCPPAHAIGAALPEAMRATPGGLSAQTLAQRLASPALDLRQGRYGRRRGAAAPGWGRRLGWIAAIGIAAHTGIAAADTVMLKVIAERRADDTRSLIALSAPGARIGDDLASSVADLLPAPSAGQGGGPFLPLLTRVSSALQPLSASIAVRALSWQGTTLILDLDSTEPDLAARLTNALRDARIAAQVTRSPDGTLRITANGA